MNFITENLFTYICEVIEVKKLPENKCTLITRKYNNVGKWIIETLRICNLLDCHLSRLI